MAGLWSFLSNNASNVIALCALFLTVWQAIVSRKHNKLSVRPYLTTWTTVLPNNNFYQVDLLNNGVGPALIKTYQVFVDSQEIVGVEAELLNKALEMLFPNSGYESYNSFLNSGYMMAAKDRHQLIKIQFTEVNIPSLTEVEAAYKRIKVLIEYESIYKEKGFFDSSTSSLLS